LTAKLPDSAIARIRFALKPASWPKLLAPMLLGQALGVHAALRAGHFDPGQGTWVLVFGVVLSILNLAYIVLLNDFADREVDALKRRMFPDAGSPKTIYDGVLSAKQVLFLGLSAGALTLLLSAVMALWLSNPWFLLGILVGLLVFWSYSLPPLRMNYRGGGELLETFGVGVVFPWIFYCAQSGRVFGAELLLLAGTTTLALSSAVASGLSDEESDRRGGKHTVVTALGNRMARRLILSALALCVPVWVLTGLISPLPLWLTASAAAFVALGYLSVQRKNVGAERGEFARLSKLKLALHVTVWGGQLVLAGLVVLRSFFGDVP
jgi:1,4-dihydroxy-2-naphthoate octaprenyltransferase/chlorophyll synthase